MGAEGRHGISCRSACALQIFAGHQPGPRRPCRPHAGVRCASCCRSRFRPSTRRVSAPERSIISSMFPISMRPIGLPLALGGSATSRQMGGPSWVSTPATCWRSRWNPGRIPFSSRRISGRRGLPPSARNRVSIPAMNWRVSSLDRYRLTSNSDAHSPGKLGREATRFSCEPDFFAMRRALETGEGYEGTVEFFPEEGKYHLDGHRACGVRLDPAETIAHDGRCLVCGNRVTFGVAHRVEMLADRKEADAPPPPTAGAVTNLVPLPEMLSEIVGGGVASQGVTRAYDRTTAALGSDFAVLGEAPVEDIAKVNPLLGEAVDRLRAGKVIRQAGYDGEYGVIRLFEEGELDRLRRGDLLFEAPQRRRIRVKNKAAPEVTETQEPRHAPAPPPDPPPQAG